MTNSNLRKVLCIQSLAMAMHDLGMIQAEFSLSLGNLSTFGLHVRNRAGRQIINYFVTLDSGSAKDELRVLHRLLLDYQSVGQLEYRNIGWG